VIVDHSWIRAAQTMKSLAAFVSDESGSGAVEYGVFAAGISASILVTVKGIGPKLFGVFSTLLENLPGAIAITP
jgi:Flp pilus assembly pilin Flp